MPCSESVWGGVGGQEGFSLKSGGSAECGIFHKCHCRMLPSSNNVAPTTCMCYGYIVSPLCRQGFHH